MLMSIQGVMIIVVAALVLPARAGWAQDVAPDQRAIAQAFFDQGSQLYKQKKFRQACSKFEAALELFPGLGTMGKLAQCFEKIGKLASSWAMYRKAEAEAKKRGDERRLTAARQGAARVEPKLAYLTVNVAEPTPGLIVARNGAEVGRLVLGNAVPVDAGSHRITATAPGRATWSGEVQIEDGQRKAITVPLLDTASKSPLRVVGLATAGVGVVSVFTASYFGWRSYSDWNEAFDSGNCQSNNTCTDSGFELTEQARDSATWGNRFLIAGVALTAIGGTVWWLSSRSSSESNVQAWQVMPTGGPRRIGLVGSRRF